MVWAGGATARACQELARRVAKIGAALLQTDVSSVTVRDSGVFGPNASVSLRDIARAFYLAPADLPGDTDPHGLEVTQGYAPDRLTGLHTGSAHAAVVAVDPETGGVEILDYAVVEDAGVLINPMIVDGQMPFDGQGQPLATTLADYLLPGSAEVPNIRVLHMETPSPYTEFGQKGVGEGGAIGPAAAIANAINDALHVRGVELCEIPITPPRILAALVP
jgi:carbon-monoxide dehydrogenase large subunit